MVGVSATRAHLRLPVSGVTTVVGILALAAGMGSIAGLLTPHAAFYSRESLVEMKRRAAEAITLALEESGP